MAGSPPAPPRALLAAAVTAAAAVTTSLARGVVADGGPVVFVAGGNYTVPEGVFFVNFSAWGAGGSGISYNVGAYTGSAIALMRGGAGAFVNGTIPVSPGETLVVEVGQPAGGGEGNCRQFMGTNCAQYSPGAGGGHSSVYRPGARLTPLVVIGGGGGGGLGNAGLAAERPGFIETYCGINGNAQFGAGIGYVGFSQCTPSSGGQQALIGDMGGGGSFLSGGRCGGGSGYYGGGGGAGTGGGGSGSSYADSTILSVSGSSSRGPWSQDQSTAPASSAAFYDTSRRVAVGGEPNQPGGPGLVVIAPTSGPASLVSPSSTPSSTSTATATDLPTPSQPALVCPSCVPGPSCASSPAELVTVSPPATASPLASASRSPSPTCRPDLEPERDHCRCRHATDADTPSMLFCDPAADASWCPSRHPRPTCHPDLTNSAAAATPTSALGGADPAAAGATPAAIAGACLASAIIGAALHALAVRVQLRRASAVVLRSSAQGATSAAGATGHGADGLGRAGADWAR